MFGMAAAALDSADIFHAAMKTRLGFDILADFLVACNAKSVLIGLTEFFMTLVALGFELRMPFYHIARHQQRFENTSASSSHD